MSGPAELKLKQKLAGVISKQLVEFDGLEKYIAPSIFNYQDILYCERRPTNSEILRRLVCLHVINHIFK
jgi:U3 small nucleolar RNA-associated protein 25